MNDFTDAKCDGQVVVGRNKLPDGQEGLSRNLWDLMAENTGNQVQQFYKNCKESGASFLPAASIENKGFIDGENCLSKRGHAAVSELKDFPDQDALLVSALIGRRVSGIKDSSDLSKCSVLQPIDMTAAAPGLKVFRTENLNHALKHPMEKAAIDRKEVEMGSFEQYDQRVLRD